MSKVSENFHRHKCSRTKVTPPPPSPPPPKLRPILKKTLPKPPIGKENLRRIVETLQEFEIKLKSSQTALNGCVETLRQSHSDVNNARIAASQIVNELPQNSNPNVIDEYDENWQNIVKERVKNVTNSTINVLHKRELNQIQEKVKDIFDDFCNMS